MPVHNGLPFVRESVRSILGQSFGDFEFIIGDDGSDDGTSAALEAFAAQDGRIRLLRREERSGLAASANWVVAHARAPLVAISHADDLSLPTRLAEQIRLIDGDASTVLVGCLSHGIDRAGRLVRPANRAALLQGRPFAPFAHSSVMFRKAAFDAVGGYRPEAEYWEDLDLYLRLADRGQVLVIPEVLSLVRHASISSRLRAPRVHVEDSVNRMYRCVAQYARAGNYEGVLAEPPAEAAKLHPRTFVACAWTEVWQGRKPKVVKRMLQRARLRADLVTLQSIVWVLWSAVHPRSLRSACRSWIELRNRRVEKRLAEARAVRWIPSRSR